MPADFWSNHIDDLLPAYHNGTLGQEERMRVDAHLRRCAACQAASADWSAIAGATGARMAPSDSPFIAPVWIGELNSRKELSMVERTSNTGVESSFLDAQHTYRFPVVAPALLLLVVLIVGLVALRLLPRDEESKPTLPAIAANGSPAATATSSVAIVITPESMKTPIVIMPSTSSPTAASCDIAPASLDRLALTGETAYTSALVFPDAEFTEGRPGLPVSSLPTGDPASAVTTAEIEETVQLIAACLEAGNAQQVSALFSDDYWRRLNAMGLNPQEMTALAYTGLVSSVSEPVPPTPKVENVVVLQDGRIGAELHPSWPGAGTHAYNYYIFVKDGGRWLVDEATNTYSRDQMTLTITDSGFSPNVLKGEAGKTDLVVINSGTKTHSVYIPDLNIRIELAAGETGQDTIVQNDGTFSFRSDTPGDSGSLFQGVIILGSGVPPTPIAGQSIPENGPEYQVPAASATIVVGILQFTPSRVTVLPNRDIEITLINDGELASNFTISALNIDIDLAPGETRTIVVNASVGAYAYYSTAQPYDLLNGMVGTLIVVDLPQDQGGA